MIYNLLPKSNYWNTSAIGQFENAFTIWIAGLPCSGKTTIAQGIQTIFKEQCIQSIHLDGDGLRQGINNNLGFSESDRAENLRRASETAKLLNSNNIITIASFITPLEVNRNAIRQIIGDQNFLFIGLECAADVCASRDVKGHYAKVKAGELNHFTGISAPFEPYSSADLVINSGELELDVCLKAIINEINQKFDA